MILNNFDVFMTFAFAHLSAMMDYGMCYILGTARYGLHACTLRNIAIAMHEREGKCQ